MSTTQAWVDHVRDVADRAEEIPASWMNGLRALLDLQEECRDLAATYLLRTVWAQA